MQVSKNKSLKIKLAKQIAENYGKVEWVILIDYSRLKAAENFDLRSKLFKSNAKMSVIKNKINSFAISSTVFKDLTSSLKGQVAVVSGNDPISMAKYINEYAKTEKLKIISASDGKTLYQVKDIVAMANLPSIEVLRAQLLSMFLAPMSSLARVLNKKKEKMESPSGETVEVENAN